MLTRHSTRPRLACPLFWAQLKYTRGRYVIYIGGMLAVMLNPFDPAAELMGQLQLRQTIVKLITFFPTASLPPKPPPPSPPASSCIQCEIPSIGKT